MTLPTHGGAEDNVRLLLTKNPARSYSTPLVGPQYPVSRSNGSRGFGRQLARYRARLSNFALKFQPKDTD